MSEEVELVVSQEYKDRCLKVANTIGDVTLDNYDDLPESIRSEFELLYLFGGEFVTDVELLIALRTCASVQVVFQEIGGIKDAINRMYLSNLPRGHHHDA